ncbi:NADH-quinone oxidoreductase subunit H [Candidatus Sulfidibacterium hydrothermale]|uniref:respiratory chain complex I subunit 1 family protein n=1 Tax=Candidatus Sulfidibacterium hydrothermale TaxID=2875962 RepID=UPI001F0A3A5A|nr:NADH-quinone oxidoreductase subunit H [Candidatus Sulfidibacterium hydrothermale]UBM62715.1 NADH-quinone oxidoreductase subunit H [Candidatus Sulfidibacterium hydrothermale]
METVLMDILGAVVTFMVAFVVGMTYGGLTRKITARIQNRKGPPWYQNFIDAFKLGSKSSAIHHGAMHHMGPAFLMVSSVMTLMVVPVLTHNNWFPNLNFQGDLIFLLYIMTFGPLGMALGAGQTGNPNSAIGVTRGLSQMVGFEIPWVLALVALMIQYHTTSITGLMAAQEQAGTWLMFSSPFAFIAAVMAMLGMFRYSPFDIVGAPTELASGPVSENGGKYLFVMMSSGSVFTFAKLTLYVDLFMGGADNLLILLVKTFALYMIPVLYGNVSPRYRTEQAVRWFWGWPSFFGLLAILQAVIF